MRCVNNYKNRRFKKQSGIFECASKKIKLNLVLSM